VTTRTFLSGGTVVLPDRVATGLTLVLENRRIVDLTATGPRAVAPFETQVDVTGRLIVPGFVDVHVHGAAGVDVMDGPDAVAGVAAAIVRWGVTAFCPTAIASPPEALDALLERVAGARAEPADPPRRARVLGAHLESNFISPDYRGAQPLACLRRPDGLSMRDDETFPASAILDVLRRRAADVAIVTLASELPGGLDLVRTLAAAGHRVSLGHSAATFDEGQAAIAAGARQATHLFNRMRPLAHREPGLAGAVLASDDMAAEIICDGHHVHPAVIRLAVQAKGSDHVMAITDGTAGSGLAPGARARLGGQPITVGDVARLADGTMAGSVLTMDRAFATLVGACGLDLVTAARMCATTPARQMGLVGHGAIAAGLVADLVVLGPQYDVQSTWIDAHPVYRRAGPAG
jgi:N-acetylglucosamine-6-phosphate deacetylase